jgi:fused signal recognition particle receptor
MALFGLGRKRDKTFETTAKTGAVWRRVLGQVLGRKTVGPELWDELEEVLITSDVGVKTAMELIEHVRAHTSAGKAGSATAITEQFRAAMLETLSRPPVNDPIPDGQPVAMLVVGVNGSGKTTSIAKLARAADRDGRKVMLGAADTFRAGAIEQLRIWGERLDVPVVYQQAGSDPGAVAFDTLSSARARGADMVLIDTAGRLHTRHNLMEELKKVRAVVDRQADGYVQRVLLVIDGTSGQNAVVQARSFTESVRCDGVMITKLDGSAKGGMALAIAGDLGLPIWFIGTGESLDDLSEFDPAGFTDALLPDSRVA